MVGCVIKMLLLVDRYRIILVIAEDLRLDKVKIGGSRLVVP